MNDIPISAVCTVCGGPAIETPSNEPMCRNCFQKEYPFGVTTMPMASCAFTMCSTEYKIDWEYKYKQLNLDWLECELCETHIDILPESIVVQCSNCERMYRIAGRGKFDKRLDDFDEVKI